MRINEIVSTLSRPSTLGVTFQSTAVFLTNQLSVSPERSLFWNNFVWRG